MGMGMRLVACLTLQKKKKASRYLNACMINEWMVQKLILLDRGMIADGQGNKRIVQRRNMEQETDSKEEREGGKNVLKLTRQGRTESLRGMAWEDVRRHRRLVVLVMSHESWQPRNKQRRKNTSRPKITPRGNSKRTEVLTWGGGCYINIGG